MPKHIFQTRLENEFETEERCFITEIMNISENADISIARARVRPGVTTALHTLNGEEYYYILKGEGVMYLGDNPPADVRSGDVVRIPEGTPQRILNSGSDDLTFLCICAPRFKPENYTSLE